MIFFFFFFLEIIWLGSKSDQYGFGCVMTTYLLLFEPCIQCFGPLYRSISLWVYRKFWILSALNVCLHGWQGWTRFSQNFDLSNCRRMCPFPCLFATVLPNFQKHSCGRKCKCLVSFCLSQMSPPAVRICECPKANFHSISTKKLQWSTYRSQGIQWLSS